MKKVLYVIDSLQTGGAEKSLLDIASRVKNVEPVVCHIYRNDFLKEDFLRAGIRVISLNINGPYEFRQAYRALKAVMIQERPDLVVASLLRSELISRMVCRALRIPNIGTFVNDSYSPYEWGALSLMMKVKVGFFWFLNMLTARYCEGFLSNSEAIKRSNCRVLFVPEEKVEVIYRGRRSDVFTFSDGHLKQDHVRFLSVGRLLFRKGYAELVEAFKQHHDRFPNSELSIAGEGPYRGQLEQKIKALGMENSIRLLGNATNVPTLLREYDVFVIPSHYEGFSGSVVEAMFSGIPIVASDITMNKEAVEHGRTARLFEVTNSKALAGEMAWVTQNREAACAYAAEARKEAEKRFTIEAIAARHEQYYEKKIGAIRNQNL